MRKLLGLLVVVVLMSFAIPVFAQDTNHECPHGGATVSNLRGCVEHAVMLGFIDNNGIANSLFAKLDAAQAALDRQQVSVATNTLNALAHAVEAQAGKHIDADHAAHLLDHIQQVINALAS